MPAKSPTMAVRMPMTPNETTKDNHPPHIPAGGTNAKIICKHNSGDYLFFAIQLTCFEFVFFYLPSERQKVHDVVTSRSVLNVSTVYIHGLQFIIKNTTLSTERERMDIQF